MVSKQIRKCLANIAKHALDNHSNDNSSSSSGSSEDKTEIMTRMLPTIQTMLATLYSGLSQYTEALPLYQSSYNHRVKLYGEMHEGKQIRIICRQ